MATHLRRSPFPVISTRKVINHSRSSFRIISSFFDPRHECVCNCCANKENVCFKRFVLQCVGMCWNVLQCVAMCCNVLQCVGMCCNVLECVAMCLNVLQCVALCCNVFECVAMCLNVLQCVWMCWNVLEWWKAKNVWTQRITLTVSLLLLGH